MTTTPGVDLEALRRHLDHVGVPVAGPLTAETVAGGRSNLTYRVTDGRSRWAVRRPPAAGRTASAHDVVREATVTRALQSTCVPVPALVELCTDETVLGAPFAVTEWVDGRIVRDRDELAGYTDEDVASICSALLDVLVSLHAVDPAAVDLSDFGRPDRFLDRQVALWRRQWEHVRTRDLPDVERLHARLTSRLPATSHAAVLHGDYRIDNVMLDADNPAHPRAVLDWELSTLGDPRTDVALMCVYRHPALDAILGLPAAWASPRLPTPDHLAESYVERSGRDLGDWAFFLALATFKLAVIAEGIAHRAHAGADAGRDARRAAEAVPELVAAGLVELA